MAKKPKITDEEIDDLADVDISKVDEATVKRIRKIARLELEREKVRKAKKPKKERGLLEDLMFDHDEEEGEGEEEDEGEGEGEEESEE